MAHCRTHTMKLIWKEHAVDNRCCFLPALLFCSYSSRPLWFGNPTQWLYQLSFKCFGSYVRSNQDACASFLAPTVIVPMLQCYWCVTCIYASQQSSFLKEQHNERVWRYCTDILALNSDLWFSSSSILVTVYRWAVKLLLFALCLLTIKRESYCATKKSTEHPTSSKMLKALVSWLTRHKKSYLKCC